MAFTASTAAGSTAFCCAAGAAGAAVVLSLGEVLAVVDGGEVLQAPNRTTEESRALIFVSFIF